MCSSYLVVPSVTAFDPNPFRKSSFNSGLFLAGSPEATPIRGCGICLNNAIYYPAAGGHRGDRKSVCQMHTLWRSLWCIHYGEVRFMHLVPFGLCYALWRLLFHAVDLCVVKFHGVWNMQWEHQFGYGCLFRAMDICIVRVKTLNLMVWSLCAKKIAAPFLLLPSLVFASIVGCF